MTTAVSVPFAVNYQYALTYSTGAIVRLNLPKHNVFLQKIDPQGIKDYLMFIHILFLFFYVTPEFPPIHNGFGFVQGVENSVVLHTSHFYY